MGSKYLEKAEEQDYTKDPELESVKRIAKESTHAKFREGYKEGIQQRKGKTHAYDVAKGAYKVYQNDKVAAEQIIHNPNYSPDANAEQKGYAMAVAHKLMGYDRSMEANYIGAKVYEKIGQGGRPSVRSKLVSKFKELARKAPEHVPEYARRVEEFLEHNPRRKGRLEEISQAAAIVGFAGAIVFLSNNITGYAIAGAATSTSNIIGAISFIVGIIATFLYFKTR